MKIGNSKFLLSLLLIVFCVSSSQAQEEARAAWQVTNFDINVANVGSERALNARAVLTVRNIGRGAGTTLTLRINAKAEIKNITIGAATAVYRSQPEPRGGRERRGRGNLAGRDAIPAILDVVSRAEHYVRVARS
jgi:hypothetical protein